MQKTITLVIPLYNEAHRAGKILDALTRFSWPVELDLQEVRLVDDGSSDATRDVLGEWKSQMMGTCHFRVKIISYANNRGRGYALRRGLSDISTDYGMYIDGDLDIPLTNIMGMVADISSNVDVIMGSKKKPGSVCTQKRKIMRMAMGYGHSVLAGLILGNFYWDYQGGFKAFSRRALDAVLPILTIDRWGFDMEVVHWALRMGFSVVEVPLIWGNITEDSRVKAVQDSLQAIKDMMVIRNRSLKWEMARGNMRGIFRWGSV